MWAKNVPLKTGNLLMNYSRANMGHLQKWSWGFHEIYRGTYRLIIPNAKELLTNCSLLSCILDNAPHLIIFFIPSRFIQNQLSLKNKKYMNFKRRYPLLKNYSLLPENIHSILFDVDCCVTNSGTFSVNHTTQLSTVFYCKQIRGQSRGMINT